MKSWQNVNKTKWRCGRLHAWLPSKLDVKLQQDYRLLYFKISSNMIDRLYRTRCLTDRCVRLVYNLHHETFYHREIHPSRFQFSCHMVTINCQSCKELGGNMFHKPFRMDVQMADKEFITVALSKFTNNGT